MTGGTRLRQELGRQIAWLRELVSLLAAAPETPAALLQDLREELDRRLALLALLAEPQGA